MTKSVSRTLLCLALAGLMTSLAACREDEQGRPLIKEKGVYQGEVDQTLSSERIDDLRSRAAGQKF